MSFNLNIKVIDNFRGEYAFLSNFAPCIIEMENYGLTFTSAEAAFQAAKCSEFVDKRRFEKLSPNEAKKLGRKVTMRPDWDEPINFRLTMMEKILRIKFSDKNPELKQKLIDTDDALLIEKNTWGDTFWGVCNGVGQNHLGKILMKIRDDLILKRV